MTQYLYAAAVQGIQDFIFETNALREIAGASEIVEDICTKEFKKTFAYGFNEEQLLIGAAGNIKYLFNEDEKGLCEAIVRRFPCEIAKIAQGITINQTVVKIENSTICSADIDKAERQLQTQRNLPTRPSNLTWMIAKRVPNTGKPAVGKDTDGYFDKASEQKNKVEFAATLFEKIIPQKLSNELKKQVVFPTELGCIAPEEHSWIAVVHADGNDLGRIIPMLFENITGAELVKKQKEFSTKLDQSTQLAAQEALDRVFGKKEADLYYDEHGKVEIPIRPIVCGGDDLTVIIRAKDALEFTQVFLEEFTNQTKEKFAGWKGLENGLTACAGITYFKQKYPFHYAVELAEGLCKYSKKIAKGIPSNHHNITHNTAQLTPACLSFYKIESAFVRGYDEILKSELTSKKIENLSLSKCPYMIEKQEQYATVNDLIKWTDAAKKSPAITTRLRQVLSMLHTQDIEAIDLELKRIANLNGAQFKQFKVDINNLSHLHDFLSINSINDVKNAENER